MSKLLATKPLPEMLEVLEYNGIDWHRVIDATLHHTVEDRVTEITVTLLALKPDELVPEALDGAEPEPPPPPRDPTNLSSGPF